MLKKKTKSSKRLKKASDVASPFARVRTFIKNHKVTTVLFLLLLLLYFWIVLNGLLPEAYEESLRIFLIFLSGGIVLGIITMAINIRKDNTKKLDRKDIDVATCGEITPLSTLDTNRIIRHIISIGIVGALLLGGFSALAKYEKDKKNESTEAIKPPSNIDSHIEVYLKSFGQKYIFTCEGDTANAIFENFKKSFDGTLPSLEALTKDTIDNTEMGRDYYKNKSHAETKYTEALDDREKGMESIWKNDRVKYKKEIHEWYLKTANDIQYGTNETRQALYIKALESDVIPFLEKAKSVLDFSDFVISHTLTLRYIDLSDAYQLIGYIDKAKELREQGAINEANALKISIQNDDDKKKLSAINTLIGLYEIPMGMAAIFEPQKIEVNNIYNALVQLKDIITIFKPNK